MESICLENQKNLSILGATKVSTSTTTQAIIEIENKEITILGKNLELTKLDLENKKVEFVGEILSIKYSHKSEPQPFLKRLFK